MTATIRQGSLEWLGARRASVSATDAGVLLGLSRYRCEADLAAEKLGLAEPAEPSLPMRVGLALEPLIRDEYSDQAGERYPVATCPESGGPRGDHHKVPVVTKSGLTSLGRCPRDSASLRRRS
jgi:hypothetical protein